MANVIRLKRRAAGGAPGAPSSLETTEAAYNETDDTLYIGFGDDGSGNATSIRAVAGAGKFVTHDALDEALENTGAGDMLKEVYDPNNDGKVSSAVAADQVPWSGVQGKPTTFPPETHGHDNAVAGGASGFLSGADKLKLDGIAAGANNYAHPTGDGNRHVPATGTTNSGKFLKAGSTAASEAWVQPVKADVGLGNVDNTSDANKPVSTAQQTALNLKADLAGATFTGNTRVPNQTAGNNSDLAANTAFVTAAVQAIVGMSPADLDTLAEIAARIQSGESDVDALVAQIAGKLTASNNLSDLANAATARTNLGLGTMAVQNATAVAITGGSISGITLDNTEIDGGTF